MDTALWISLQSLFVDFKCKQNYAYMILGILFMEMISILLSCKNIEIRTHFRAFEYKLSFCAELFVMSSNHEQF